MALTVDWTNQVVHSSASLTDMVAFHGLLRDLEASTIGVLYPVIHTYKELPLGGGALFPALAFVNGWTLQFPAGNFLVSGGNLAADINPVANCYIDRTQAAAYAVTAVGGGGGGLTVEQETMLRELWRKEGLDATRQVEHTPTSIKVGDPLNPEIEIALTGNRKTLTVMERQ